MYGEKFLEKKIEGNKIIRISEFKKFNHNYLDLIEDLYDKVTDDCEALADKSIYIDRLDDFVSFNVDEVLAWVVELMEEGEEEDIAWLEDWVKLLQEAKGFVIYFQNDAEMYK